jgi:hypothetical protein
VVIDLGVHLMLLAILRFESAAFFTVSAAAHARSEVYRGLVLVWDVILMREGSSEGG